MKPGFKAKVPWPLRFFLFKCFWRIGLYGPMGQADRWLNKEPIIKKSELVTYAIGQKQRVAGCNLCAVFVIVYLVRMHCMNARVESFPPEIIVRHANYVLAYVSEKVVLLPLFID